MELDYALSQIADIQQQMNRTRRFRGFRAATTFAMASAALAAALWQSREMPDAAIHPMRFVVLWICVAAVCIGASAVELIWRYRDADSLQTQQLTPLAVEHFFPFVVVGGLLTLVLCECAPESIWMLPGLWQILFGLGLIAVRRLFPTPIVAVGAFYILCGFANLGGIVGHFSALSMAFPFGVGQTANAIVLYWYLERRHAA